MRIEAGVQLDQYRLVEKIGEGGMGVVWKARDTTLDRDVAIKVLPEKLARDEEFLARFEREAKAVAALSHPNILTIFDFGEEREVAFAVTELLEGETLGEALTSSGALSVERTLEVALAVADGLAAAHRRRIVHRDLKPSNLFLTAEGGVKILDFGLARSEALSRLGTVTEGSEAPPATRPGTILGTVGYMSPEQTKGLVAGPASDVFSFGCVLYEMVAGGRPFARRSESETLAAILGEAPPPVADGVPYELRQVIEKALEKEPEDRFSSGVELLTALEEVKARLLPAEGAPSISALELFRRPSVAIPGALLLAFAIFWVVRSTGVQKRRAWARETALPEIVERIDAAEYRSAFALARKVEAIVPDEPLLRQLWDRMSTEVRVETEPPGAEIFAKDYKDLDGAWQHLGTSPIEAVRLSRGGYRWRIEKAGYEVVERATRVPHPSELVRSLENPDYEAGPGAVRFHFTLDRDGAIPQGMVSVDAKVFGFVPLSGYPAGVPAKIDRFFIDRTEVTNRAFKGFVDARGYERPELWKEPFLEEGRRLSWEEAMARFVDQTGRPGPATWIVGSYPDGEGDHPVGGVSWYEAATYAEYRKQRLPTLLHWIAAAVPAREVIATLTPFILPQSNVGGDGPAPVASSPAISVSGAYDMAGNVQEWCWNEGPVGRVVLGGAWDQPVYHFNVLYSEPAWDRSPRNGLRLMQLPPGEEVPAELARSIERVEHDAYAMPAISDEAFAATRRLYAYDLMPLRDERAEAIPWKEWTRETVNVATPYGERLPLHLHLPTHLAAPPYQSVIYFPGAQGFLPGTFEELKDTGLFDFLVDSGRALVEPVFDGMYERNAGEGLHMIGSSDYERLQMRWVQDVGRTLDYLESRQDLDAGRIAFFGLSLGATVGPLVLAQEARFTAAVLMDGGFSTWRSPELLAGAVDNVQRTRVPVMMINGRYDHLFRYDTSQRPMYELFGAAPEDKEHVVFDTSHGSFPRVEVIKHTLRWLDRYLGPVERRVRSSP